jgi:hypothetical protein
VIDAEAVPRRDDQRDISERPRGDAQGRSKWSGLSASRARHLPSPGRTAATHFQSDAATVRDAVSHRPGTSRATEAVLLD